MRLYKMRMNMKVNCLNEDAKLFLEEYDIEEIENINPIDSNYDENAIAYFAGFVARRSFTTNSCDDCRNV